jgi:hypothetical protein
MRGTWLESFLLLLVLRSFVAMAHPIADLETEELSVENSISRSASNSDDSIASYTCVYIPPDLDFCNFIR